MVRLTAALNTFLHKYFSPSSKKIFIFRSFFRKFCGRRGEGRHGPARDGAARLGPLPRRPQKLKMRGVSVRRPGVQTSERPDVRASERLTVQTSERPEVRASERPSARTSVRPRCSEKYTKTKLIHIRPSHLFDRRTCSTVADSEKILRAFGPQDFFLVNFFGLPP